LSDLSLNLDANSLVGGSLYDLKMVNGDFVLTNDGGGASPLATNGIQQQIVTRLRWFLGEYFLNVDGGTPWLQSILRHNADPSEVDAILQEVILSTPGVLVLTAYRGDADLARRTYRVTFTVKTTAGTVNYTLPLTVTGNGAT
jgi:hypothetical protein